MSPESSTDNAPSQVCLCLSLEAVTHLLWHNTEKGSQLLEVSTNSEYQAVSKKPNIQHKKPEVWYFKFSKEQLLTPPLPCNQEQEHF